MQLALLLTPPYRIFMEAIYSVKSIFLTKQGEGIHAGRWAVFCRFSGCNLWSGDEDTRQHALCRLCDTDFKGVDGIGGGHLSAHAIAQKANALWKTHKRKEQKRIVCTGGEPLLQLDDNLIETLHKENFHIHVETNGTLAAPCGIDWLTVSPKAGTHLRLWQGDELKIVLPQEGWQAQDIEKFRQKGTFKHYFLQPRDDGLQLRHAAQLMAYCAQNPAWRLSLQLHKLWNIP